MNTIINLKSLYTEEELKELLTHLDPYTYRWNKGYRTWIILDTEMQPNLYTYDIKTRSWMILNTYIKSQRGYTKNNEYLKVMYYRPNGFKVEETVHRLTHYAWTGESTQHRKGWDIDHINGNIYDNRPSNLRMVTHEVNCNNKHTPERKEQLEKCYNNKHQVELVL